MCLEPAANQSSTPQTANRIAMNAHLMMSTSAPVASGHKYETKNREGTARRANMALEKMCTRCVNHSRRKCCGNGQQRRLLWPKVLADSNRTHKSWPLAFYPDLCAQQRVHTHTLMTVSKLALRNFILFSRNFYISPCPTRMLREMAANGMAATEVAAKKKV